MPFVVGHSQTKYLSQYLSTDSYTVFSYPGYRTCDILKKDIIYEVVPFFSVVVVVVGANDIGSRSPQQIVSDIRLLCEHFHLRSPSATILVSEILPRAQNLFTGCHLRKEFLDHWNYDAGAVNRLLHSLSTELQWIRIIEHTDFHTLFGANRQLLSKDGLHLSYEGTQTFTSNIEEAVRAVPTSRPAETQSCTSKVVPSITTSLPAGQDSSATNVVLSKSAQLPVEPSSSTLKVLPSNSVSLPAETQSPTTLPAGPQSPTTLQAGPQSPTSRAVPSDSELDELVKWIEDAKQIPSRQQSGGGGVSIPFSTQNTPLSTQYVEDLMCACESGLNKEKICSAVPTEINSGDIYVIDLDSLPNKKDVRIDKYMWLNDGRKKIPNKKPTLFKTFFKIRLPDNNYSKSFQKYIFERIENGKFAILHYIGDASVYQPLAHGNSKKGSVFVRTCPSVIDEIKSRADDVSASANLIDKELKCRAKKGADFGVKTSRNLDQVKNHLYKTRREKRFSNDEIYNLCEISIELENFNKQIDVYPTLVCISGLEEIQKEFNELLTFDSGTTIKMYYDTTYKMGQLFVSVLSYQHVLFEGNKIIPVAFVMHERRDSKFHERFFNVIKEHIPNLSKTKYPIICDREAGIKLAIKNSLPNIPIVHCWNHIKTDVKTWLHKLKGTNDDRSVYLSHVDTLLRCFSESEYSEKLSEFKELWSTEFRKYYEKNLHPSIIENSGRWLLEEYNIYNPYSGITTNPAESVNNMIKSVQQRKELPVDLICLNLLMCQKAVYADIQCGRAGFGNFKLKKDCEYARIDPSEIDVPDITGTPDEILKVGS
ncbi:uncharacterized protein LOC128559236 [Mercenaria mercenaria]|uniref:uncharacterized protein LOC128559236 n=1 Tax=Mercenaria mercenaria TaxID=6596 RepID=UPI00234EC883|nr:uncharacterized protein LOC128559236 [Mercenaria mercenaria]